MLDNMVGEVLDFGKHGMPLDEVAQRILPAGVKLEVDPPADFRVIGEWDARDLTVSDAIDTLFMQVGYDVEWEGGGERVVVRARPCGPWDPGALQALRPSLS